MYYQVIVHEIGATHGDGSRVIIRDCGHKHQKYDTAEKCRSKLLAYNQRTKMWVAAWHNSAVWKIVDNITTYADS